MTPSTKGAFTALTMAALALPAAARAQDWVRQEYAADNFAVQLPVDLQASKVQIQGPGGQSAPETLYSVRQDGAVFEMAVADLHSLSLDNQAALDFGVKTVIGAGKVRVQVTERIDRVFGRELTVDMPDGGQVMASVFFLNGKLYMLRGRALPPDPAEHSSQLLRFQQSLEFIGLGFEANRPENRAAGAGQPGDGQGPGGQGRRREPPPQAFADCRGKAEGDEVQHTTPQGVVPARCVVTPQGLAARPLRPPQGGAGGPPPPDQNGPPPT